MLEDRGDHPLGRRHAGLAGWFVRCPVRSHTIGIQSLTLIAALTARNPHETPSTTHPRGTSSRGNGTRGHPPHADPPRQARHVPQDLWDEVARPIEPDRVWSCLHTKPRQEKATARDLRAARTPFYLPQVVHEDRTPGGRKTRSILPLFGGYLFLFGDKSQRLDALRGNRLVNILEVADQDGLIHDLRQIHQMLRSGLAIMPESSVPVGGQIRITNGPLTGLVGTVVRRGKRDDFVAVVKMLGLGTTVALEDWHVDIIIE
jgi:hypothetical protein